MTEHEASLEHLPEQYNPAIDGLGPGVVSQSCDACVLVGPGPVAACGADAGT